MPTTEKKDRGRFENLNLNLSLFYQGKEVKKVGNI